MIEARVGFKSADFCLFLVFRGTVVSQESRGDLTRLGVRIHDVWKNKGGLAQRHLPAHVRRNQSPTIAVWVPLTKQAGIGRISSIGCTCPRFEVDQTYLFISQAYEVSSFLQSHNN